MINAQNETAELLRNRLEHVHDGLSDGIVVLVAGPAVTRTSGDRVDHDQPERQPKLLRSEASACRAMAINFSTAPLCSSIGAVSYQRNGAAAVPPHFSRTTASSRSRTSSAPSAAINSTPHCRFTVWPEKRLSGAKRGRQIEETKVLPVPHWPDRAHAPQPA